MEQKLKILREVLGKTELKKAQPLKVLEKSLRREMALAEIASLLCFREEIQEETFQIAQQFNLEKFQKKIEFYGVSYISDFCVNNCSYCGHSLKFKHCRSRLSEEAMAKDFSAVLQYGPSEICILAGEDPKMTPEYFVLAGKIALENDKHQSLERITFNVAPMSLEQFKKIRKGIDFPLQFRIFQESYDSKIYALHHSAGPKADFLFRLNAQARALEVGFDEVGIGSLLGLNTENNLEILGLILHAYYLQKKYNKFPYSVSMPRLQKISFGLFEIPNAVDDKVYSFYHAVLRLALPETKIIITTREKPKMRDSLRPLINIEDLATRPGVGGNYRPNTSFQNTLGDTRTSVQIIEDLLSQGYVIKTV